MSKVWMGLMRLLENFHSRREEHWPIFGGGHRILYDVASEPSNSQRRGIHQPRHVEVDRFIEWRDVLVSGREAVLADKPGSLEGDGGLRKRS